MAEAPTCWEDHLALTAARYVAQAERLETMGESYSAMRLRMMAEDVQAHAARLRELSGKPSPFGAVEALREAVGR